MCWGRYEEEKLLVKCKLAIKMRGNIVASGYILKTNSTNIHGNKMPIEVARVVVEVAHEEMAWLPFPNLNAGITFVGQAVGVPVVWDKHLIIDESERGQKQKQEDIEAMIPSTQYSQPPKLPLVEPLTQEVVSISHNDLASMSSILTSLLKFLSQWDNDHHKNIKIPSHVFGYNTISTLFMDDVTQFCNMENIGQTLMILYLSCWMIYYIPMG